MKSSAVTTPWFQRQYFLLQYDYNVLLDDIYFAMVRLINYNDAVYLDDWACYEKINIGAFSFFEALCIKWQL